MRHAERFLMDRLQVLLQQALHPLRDACPAIEKSRHFHPFPRLMMQFDDMILHVLLCSLSLVAEIIAQILNHHPNSPTQ